ncbi:MAG: HAD family hydrolase [Thermodesulfobacteriota bacterium]
MPSRNKKVLSFDLDGTLVQHDFSTAVWREAIPALLARERGIPLEDAKTWVYREYESVGEGSLEWYDLGYWYRRFRLQEDWNETLRRHRFLIRAFPEVPEVLRKAGETHRLIILSNASRPFVHEEMEATGFSGFFERVISATSDLGEVKKTREFYKKVCSLLALDPHELIHVGDHWAFDYLAPQEAGVRAYFLDRSGKDNGGDVVRDLREFAKRVMSPGGTRN